MRYLKSYLVLTMVMGLLSSLMYAGQTVKQERDVSGFTEVKLTGHGTVYLTQGSEYKVIVEADEDDMEDIVTQIKGNSLVLKKKKRYFDGFSDITYYITMKKVDGLAIAGSGEIISKKVDSDDLSLAISGSGEIEIDALTARSLDLAISGSGDVTLAGNVPLQKISISGSGDYKAKNLVGETVTVDVAGSGKAEVNASADLTINSAGSGDIVYYGGTPRINSSMSGSKKIRSGDSNLRLKN